MNVGKHCSRLLGGLRIVGPHFGTLADECPQDIKGRRKADVVGIGFESKAPHRDFSATNNPQLLADLLDEVLDSSLIDVYNFLQEREVAAGLLRDADEGLYVFREAEPSKTNAWDQERRSDPWIHAHSQSDLGHICADRLAQVRNHVDERDLHSQERVRRVLDQLGRIGIRYDPRRLPSALAVGVNRTLKCLL